MLEEGLLTDQQLHNERQQNWRLRLLLDLLTLFQWLVQRACYFLKKNNKKLGTGKLQKNRNFKLIYITLMS